MLLVIDADSLVYTAAHAAERTLYAAQYPDGTVSVDLPWTEARKAEGQEGALLYRRYEAQDAGIACAAAKRMLQIIQEQVKTRFGKVNHVRVLLQGYGNFRERRAAVIRYKYNRVENRKPKHYGTVRKYLVDVHKAGLVHWYETDDECSILQTQLGKDCCVSSIDKDLLQVPGWHHIPDKGFMYVDEHTGLFRFYRQALTGDSTDGIPGCKGVGAKTATRILSEAVPQPKALSLDKCALAWWQAVLQCYIESGQGEAAALETAQLVWMLRERPAEPWAPKLWSPPQ